jgi:RNA polymerase sigma-70 factor (ECF subfamily)
MQPSDAELLDRWQKGDREAGKALFERYYETLECFFVNKVTTGIGDLVHETLRMCLEARERIHDPDKFRSYLFSIAYNVLRGHFRKQGRRGAEIDLDDLDDVSMQVLSPGPRSVLVEREEQRLLLEALRSIPLKDQWILELQYWESLPIIEIAEILDVPLGTAKSRLHRARKHLEEALEKLASSPELLQSTQADLDAWAHKCRLALGRSKGNSQED